MELSLRVGAALIGLLVIVAFLRSVLQVAIVNRQRGDWLARRVGWLVYTILARRGAEAAELCRRPGCAGMGFTAIHPVADRRVVWLGASRLFIANLVVPSRAQLLASGDCQRLGAQHPRLLDAAWNSWSTACNPRRRDGAWRRCILFYFHPRISDDDPTAADQGRLARAFGPRPLGEDSK